jgi:predicted RNase H-like nuclease (RuvC/YqgF family)
MGTNKLVGKLEKYFDLSKKKQRKKHDKLLKIIGKLQEEQSRLEQEVQKEREIDAASSRYQDLERELLVISGLISKAKQKDLTD